MDLFLPKKVPDLDGGVVVGDGRVDWEVGVDEAHLVTVPFGDPGDEVLDVADGSAYGSCGLPRPEPCIHLQLLPALDEIEIEVEVLEVTGELAARTLHLHDLRVHLHGDSLGDVHGLRGKDRLHLALSFRRLGTQTERGKKKP